MPQKKNTTPKPRKPRSTGKNSFSASKKYQKGSAVSYTLIIPSGPCPIELKGTSKKVVKKWCDQMIAHFATQKQYLGVSTEAYKYYVRYYYNSNSQEFKDVCALIDEFVPDVKLEEQLPPLTTTEETPNE